MIYYYLLLYVATRSDQLGLPASPPTPHIMQRSTRDSSVLGRAFRRLALSSRRPKKGALLVACRLDFACSPFATHAHEHHAATPQ